MRKAATILLWLLWASAAAGQDQQIADWPYKCQIVYASNRWNVYVRDEHGQLKLSERKSGTRAMKDCMAWMKKHEPKANGAKRRLKYSQR
jgi:hypothetical protein